MVQFGKFGHAELRAWTVASETGYTWSQLGWWPRLSLSANVASGDRDRLDPDLQTFNPLFPRGTYFAEDATLGPQNFYNAHLFLSVQPAEIWRVTVDFNRFWRLSTQDGVYSPNGRLLRPSGGSESRAVADSWSFSSEWQFTRSLSATAIYARSSPREFLRDSGASEIIDFVELTLRYRF